MCSSQGPYIWMASADYGNAPLWVYGHYGKRIKKHACYYQFGCFYCGAMTGKLYPADWDEQSAALSKQLMIKFFEPYIRVVCQQRPLPRELRPSHRSLAVEPMHSFSVPSCNSSPRGNDMIDSASVASSASGVPPPPPLDAAHGWPPTAAEPGPEVLIASSTTPRWTQYVDVATGLHWWSHPLYEHLWFFAETGNQNTKTHGCGSSKTGAASSAMSDQVSTTCGPTSGVPSSSSMGDVATDGGDDVLGPLPPTRADCTHRQSVAMMFHGGKEPEPPNVVERRLQFMSD